MTLRHHGVVALTPTADPASDPAAGESSGARIDVIGLGPAGPDLLTAGTLALVEEIPHRWLRTSRHPAASAVDAPSFDAHYEAHDTFAQVYEAIVADLVAAARESGRVLYAVPGSPWVAEHTVELLAALSDDPATADIDVVIHPALSFVDLTWVVLGIDPIADGVRIVDGHRFASEAAGDRGPLLISQCHDQATLSDIKLAIDPLNPTETDDLRVTVLQRLGLPDQHVFDVAWNDLDRIVEADHLTSLYVPELPMTVGSAFTQFAVMVERLRAECPWDAEQTHGTLRRYLLEESYETLEALDHLVETDDDDPLLPDRYADLAEEMGDLLYQIFFHSILASEEGWFDVAGVARGIHDKLFERHPHVYGDVEVSLEDLPAQWEAQKKAEKSRESVMDGIPAALPALLYATKVQKKAAAIGQAVPDGGALVAADEAEIGELLFHTVALARELGIDAESALRQRAVGFADAVRATEEPAS